VNGFSTPTTAGTMGSLVVQARDAAGALLPGFRGTVHFTSTDPQAVLPADYTFTAADNGVHIFAATLTTAGTRSITVTDTLLPGSTGRQSGIVVSAAAPSTLTLSGLSTPITAGQARILTLTARDVYGNVAPGYLGTVHFTSGDSKAGLPADYTFTAADHGVHKFTVILKTAGTQSVTDTDTVMASLSSSASATVN